MLIVLTVDHVVFTVPEEIAAITYQNKKVIYDILFRTTAETLKLIAADPKHLGAEIGPRKIEGVNKGLDKASRG
jgi:hypothetical protein